MQYILQYVIPVLVRETILIPKRIFHTPDSKMKKYFKNSYGVLRENKSMSYHSNKI